MHKPQERIFSKQNVYNLNKEWRQHFQPDPNSLSANPQILRKNRKPLKIRYLEVYKKFVGTQVKKKTPSAFFYSSIKPLKPFKTFKTLPGTFNGSLWNH